MGFNIFKSKKTADAVYYNGNIYAGYGFSNVVEAVAVKDGKILALGDLESLDDHIDDNTFLYDMEGKYVFPGFIETIERPVMNIFFKEYIHLDNDMSAQNVIEGIENVLFSMDEADVVFGYGYGNETFKDMTREEITAKLSEVDTEKPLLLVHDNCLTCAYNDVAESIIRETAEEEMVQIITLPYVLNLLLPFDYETISEQYEEMKDEYVQKGITCIYNWGSPNFFDEVFENAILEDLNQGKSILKFQGALTVKSPMHVKLLKHLLGQLRAKCTEISDWLEHEILYIEMNDDFKSDVLGEMIKFAEEMKIKVHVFCKTQEQTDMFYASCENLDSGDLRNSVVLFTDKDIDTSRFEGEFLNYDRIEQLSDRPRNRRELFNKHSNTEAIIKDLTENAAEILGRENDMGIISEGYVADFTAFDNNPLEMVPAKFFKETATITITNGELAYNEQMEADDELYQMFSRAPL